MEQPDVPQDDRVMSLLAYLLTLVTSFIPPLIIYFVKKDQSRFVAFHALQSLFLQLAVIVGSAVLGLLAMIPFVGCLTLPLALGLGLADLVFVIIAAIKASGGEWYEVPGI